MSEPTATETPIPETPVLSIREHLQTFSAEAREQATATAEPAEPATPETPETVTETAAEARARDEQGKFAKGERHRAQSQKPGVIIPELKKNLQAERDRAAALEKELADIKATRTASPPTPTAPAAPVEPVKPEPPRAASPDDPEPTQDDPKYAEDWIKWSQDHARWAARDEYRQIRAREAAEATQQKQATEFGARISKAKEKYADFEAVAFKPIAIPQGSVADAFILEDDAGPEILYHLQSHPQELADLLRSGSVAQAKTLSLLSQRLLADSGTQAGTTGAVAPPKTVVLPPRPATPVRTEAQRAFEPPPTDGTLSMRQHIKTFKRA